MKFEWDFKEFKDFANDLSEFANFEMACRDAAIEISKILREMLINQTPVESGELRSGWSRTGYKIIRTEKGFEVELSNNVEYALSVNDGHMSFNQYGGPYNVDDKNRKKVPRPNKLQKYPGGSKKTYVYGHFFVESSIAIIENSDLVERLIMNELKRWFRRCGNG